MSRKKASLNLSINAIVVLILAITMLGLGLTFMNKIFGGATGQFEEMIGAAKTQMVNQLQESGEDVALDRTSVEISKGKNTKVLLALKNDQAAVDTFTVSAIECVELDNTINIITGDPGNGITICEGGPSANVVLNIGYQETYKVQPGDVSVRPIKFDATSKAVDGTYAITFNIQDTEIGINKDITVTVDTKQS